MDLELYGEILNDIHNHKGYPKDLQNILLKKYPNVLKDTIISIISNESQKLARKCNHKNSQITDTLFSMYLEGREAQEDAYSLSLEKLKFDHKKILKMAMQFNIPATLVARIILSKFYETEKNKEVKKLSKKNISEMLMNTHLIDDSDLSVEVYWSTLYDDQYSPLIDIVKQQIGYEYECKLRYCCTQENLVFKDEHALRKEGYDKTPDIKLEMPILVNGVAITWIESKALFADDEIHKWYTRDQYLSYWNRWGPGLIIYWFGYTVDVPNSSEKRFIIMNDFPKSDNIVHLDCAQVNQKTVEDMTEKH